jgi:hypothetical protein
MLVGRGLLRPRLIAFRQKHTSQQHSYQPDLATRSQPHLKEIYVTTYSIQHDWVRSKNNLKNEKTLWRLFEQYKRLPCLFQNLVVG